MGTDSARVEEAVKAQGGRCHECKKQLHNTWHVVPEGEDLLILCPVCAQRQAKRYAPE